METFEKDLTYLSKTLQDNQLIDIEITKTVQFKELNRSDKSQHKLHGMIISVLSSGEFNRDELTNEENIKIVIDYDKIYDLSTKVIKQLSIQNEQFTENDRIEMLNDSFCIYSFGIWFFANKAAPFFSKLRLI